MKLLGLMIRWPWVARYEKRITELEVRIRDIERHFVTQRKASGEIVETLADIPVEKRDDLRKRPMAGRTWQQRKAWLERTDGGRLTG